MSKLYIASIEEKDTLLYGLFYDDKTGVRQPHMEEWKLVCFENESEAQKRLEEIETERAREDGTVSFTLDEAKAFAETHKWKFASTYAKTTPHEYLVKRWLSDEDKSLYERFVQTMKHNSVIGYFYGHKNDYLILGDHYYWFMGQHDNMAVDLINRTTTDYLEFKDGVYYYKRSENNNG